MLTLDYLPKIFLVLPSLEVRVSSFFNLLKLSSKFGVTTAFALILSVFSTFNEASSETRKKVLVNYAHKKNDFNDNFRLLWQVWAGYHLSSYVSFT